MWKEKITLPFQYDFDFVLRRMKEDPLIRLNVRERWVDVPVEKKEVVRVRAEGTTAAPVFLLEGEKNRESSITRVFDIFLWHRNMDEVRRHFKESSLAALDKKFPATPVVKGFDLYASLMKTIIHQQLNKSFAYTLSTRFVESFGYKKGGVWFYPEPETVADIAYDDLRELQFSRRKAEYVIDTSRLISEGEVDLHSYSSMTDDEVMKEMTKIRGIGKWTAQNWLMTGLGRPDLLPEADVGIQNGWKSYYELSGKPSSEEIRVKGAEWKPYRSYAALLLWREITGK